MAVERVVEEERKYDVDTDTPLPDLDGVAGVVVVGEPTITSLDAVYFDTPDLRLAASAIMQPSGRNLVSH